MKRETTLPIACLAAALGSACGGSDYIAPASAGNGSEKMFSGRHLSRLVAHCAFAAAAATGCADLDPESPACRDGGAELDAGNQSAPDAAAPATEIIPADRRIDWRPGIPGGIPARTTVCADVKTDFGARGDGVTDDTAAIRSAIAACPANQVVYLPAGTYALSAELAVSGKGVVVRGAGPDQTRLVSHATTGNVISFVGQRTTTVANILSGADQGSTAIAVDDASSFAIGDFVIVDQRNDPALVSNVGNNGSCTWCSRESGARAQNQVVEIVGKDGTALILGRPLYFTLSPSLAPQIVKLSHGSPKYAGIEDLTVERTGSATSGDNIRFTRCLYCWVKNVESRNCAQHHVYLWTTYGVEVRDSYFHHASSFAGGYGYGVRLAEGGSDNLVENNILYYLRHTVIFGGGGSGNVIAYNYSARVFDDRYPDTNWLMGDILTHGAHPFMNLIEGNVMAHLVEDGVWGTASHNTYFRNHVERRSQGEAVAWMQYALWAVDFYAGNTSQNVIGNVLGTPGCGGLYEAYPVNGSGDQRIFRLGLSGSTGNPDDPRVGERILRHGNYDYVTNDAVWDDAIAERALPPSLYLTGKPAFFGELPWPAIGPDVDGQVSTLPAKQRFDTLVAR